MDELLSEFLTETNESISTLDVELVKLEQQPDNPGLIDNIFRLVHTIKGTCGFLGLPRLEAVAHSSENVLGKIRDGEMVVTAPVVSVVLESLDRIKEILAALEATEAEPAGDDSVLIKQLDDMALSAMVAASQGSAPAPDAAVEPDVSPVAEVSQDPDPSLGRELKPGEVSLEELERVFMSTESDVPEATSGPSEAAAAAPSDTTAATPSDQPDAAAKASGAKSEGGHESAIANQSIRVNVDQLENLMTMVSELVLTRNQLMQMVRGHEDSEFKVPLQRLSHVTTELQEGVMKTRMQPIGNAWAKLPRIIRDLSHELGKKIDLQMLGADTELDRQVLELIKDPLTHMVRNSADHGLETPAERVAAGKTEVGNVVLNAYHEGGHIIIEIKDDGHGLKVEKIRDKVLEKGLTTEAELENLTDQQILQFIFKAGFSTAEQVTNVSGRGVGMDVVRTNIEKIGGTVDLKTVEGAGTTFTIKIPLTLAIVSALIVECRNERFAIPQISVLELVRASKESEHRVEVIKETPVLRLRDRLLPLVYLGDCLALEGADEVDLNGDTEVYVVVTQIGSYTFGIVVDRVYDTEEIVVKPVAPLLRDIKMFSGNTILGDGSVIMILDPNGIAAASGDVSVPEAPGHELAAGAASRGDEKMAFLLFRAGSAEPKAVPLSIVARLEEIDVNDIEHANGRMVVQYRGHLMPLSKIDHSYEFRTEGRQPVIVFSDEERTLGLAVEEIVDIVEDHLNMELKSDQAGFMGSAVIGGRATEVIDVGHFIQGVCNDWFAEHSAKAFGGESARRILLVEDSPFFRNMLTPLLEVAGYEVTTADDADTALMLREEGQEYDVIISDIEMPGMSGFDFAVEVKRDDRWQKTPLVALSSHTNERDFERGRAVGFDDYIAKLDQDGLLRSLSQTLAIQGEAA